MTSGSRVVVLAAFWLGCAAATGSSPSYRVASATPIGPLLDVRLQSTSRSVVISSDPTRSLLFPASETCRRLLQVDSIVQYLPGGLTGSIRRDGHACEAVGIAALREWRDRRPRPARRRMGADRAQATYRIAFEQENMAIVRGRFPLAGRVGWVGGEDTLALIPRTAGCAGVLERQVSSMEYRDAGPIALLLVSKLGCPIEGFARIVPELADR